MLIRTLKQVLPAVVLMLLGMVPLCVHAEEAAIDRDGMVEMINGVLADSDKRQAAIEAGSDRSVLCSVCHGADGNSKKPGVPNLAGQNPIYLVEQIGKFASGERKNFVMQSLSGNFTLEDRVNLAIYFSSRVVHPSEADASIAAKGQAIYERQCINCHGPKGRGEAGYARIASQKVDYLETTLRRFRDIAIKREKVSDAVRHDERMEQATQNLTDADIRAVAAYVALLE